MSGQLPGAATHHLRQPFPGVLDLGHVLPQDPPVDVLRWGRVAGAQQFREHQWLIDGAHAHPLGDGEPEALVGGGGVRGHGAILDGCDGGGTHARPAPTAPERVAGPGEHPVGHPSGPALRRQGCRNRLQSFSLYLRTRTGAPT